MVKKVLLAIIVLLATFGLFAILSIKSLKGTPQDYSVETPLKAGLAVVNNFGSLSGISGPQDFCAPPGCGDIKKEAVDLELNSEQLTALANYFVPKNAPIKNPRVKIANSEIIVTAETENNKLAKNFTVVATIENNKPVVNKIYVGSFKSPESLVKYAQQLADKIWTQVLTDTGSKSIEIVVEADKVRIKGDLPAGLINIENRTVNLNLPKDYKY